MEPKLKILYIIGSARSGSTLLDIILGNSSSCFSAGELNRFNQRNGIPHDARNSASASFWCDVNKELITLGYSSPESYYDNFSKFEYHSFFYRLHGAYDKRSFDSYKAYQKDLFQKIYSNASILFNKHVIVDSSKYPLRAYFLAKIFGADISFIYLYRNPVAVTQSFQKRDIEQPAKSRLAANTYILIANVLTKKVVGRLKRTHKTSTISYESLMDSPIKTIQKIENDLLLDLAVPKSLIANNQPLQVGYLFDGNRLRFNSTITFRRQAGINLRPIDFIDKIFGILHRLFWYKHAS